MEIDGSVYEGEVSCAVATASDCCCAERGFFAWERERAEGEQAGRSLPAARLHPLACVTPYLMLPVANRGRRTQRKSRGRSG